MMRLLLLLILSLLEAPALAWEPECPLGTNPDASWEVCLDGEEFDYPVTAIADNGSGAIRLTHANNPSTWYSSTTASVTGTIAAEDGSVRLLFGSTDISAATLHNTYHAIVNVGGTTEANGRHIGRMVMRQATVDASANTFTLTSSIAGLANNDRVYVRLGYNTGGTAVSSISGPSTSTAYYVKGLSGNVFQISTTAGGAAVDVTAVNGNITIQHDSMLDLPDVAYRNAWTSGGVVARRYALVKNSPLTYSYWPITSIDSTNVDLVGSTYAGPYTGTWYVSPCDDLGASEVCWKTNNGANALTTYTLADGEHGWRIQLCPNAPVGTHCYKAYTVRSGSGPNYNYTSLTGSTEISARWYDYACGLKNGKSSHSPALIYNSGGSLATEDQGTGFYVLMESKGAQSTALSGGNQSFLMTEYANATVPVSGVCRWTLFEMYGKIETTWADGVSRDVTAIADNGSGLVKLTFANPHGHAINDTVTISGADASWGINGTWTISAVTNATALNSTITLAASTYVLGSGAKGTAALKDGKGTIGECDGVLKVWIEGSLVISHTDMCHGRLNNVSPGYVGLQFNGVWGPRLYEHRNVNGYQIAAQDAFVVKTSSFTGSGPYIGRSSVEKSVNLGTAGTPYIVVNAQQDNWVCEIDYLTATGASGSYSRAACIDGMPNTITISGLASGTGGVIRATTSAVHGLWTGDEVFIRGGDSGAGVNGYWTITLVDSTHFELNGSTYVTTSVATPSLNNRYGSRKIFADCSIASALYSKHGALQSYTNLGYRNHPGSLDPTKSADDEPAPTEVICGPNGANTVAAVSSSMPWVTVPRVVPGSYRVEVDGTSCGTTDCGAGAFYSRDAGLYDQNSVHAPLGKVITNCGSTNTIACGPSYTPDMMVVNLKIWIPSTLPASTYSSCDTTNKSCVVYSGFTGYASTKYGNYLGFTITSAGNWGAIQRDNNTSKVLYTTSTPVVFDTWNRVELLVYLSGADADKITMRVNGTKILDKQTLTYKVTSNTGGHNWLHCTLASGGSCSDPGYVEGIIDHSLGAGDVKVWIDQFTGGNASAESCDGWDAGCATRFTTAAKSTKIRVR